MRGRGTTLVVDEVKTASAVAPMRGRGTTIVVDEVKTAQAVAPMRGRGTTLVVDEVTCEPAPLRKAFFAAKSELPNKKDAA